MKTTKKMRFFPMLVLFAGLILMVNSCKNEDDIVTKVGSVVGTVSDEIGMPIADVTVAISGVEGTVTTGSNGTYTFENVSIESHVITFSKDGYQTTSATIAESKFDASTKVATINISMVTANAKITGKIIDALNGDAPLAGVTVSINENTTTTSADDGTYTLKNLPVSDYTVTFSKSGYTSISRTVVAASFDEDGIAALDVRMGGNEILPGLVAEDLANADKWYYNEYRGGRNGDSYPHWDWSTDYMAALDFQGAWEEQNEGTTLQIQNESAQQSNPANLDAFDSYVYGSKKITDDNKILSLRVRTHSATEDAPAYFGVQVVDLSAANPSAVKIGENKTYASEDYADFDFDLSAYVGKEVIIAVGIYRKETGDYYKQLVLRAIRFAHQKVVEWNWLPGTEPSELSGWKLTQEMLRSTMPQTKTSFTGISPVSGSRDSYQEAYRSWRTVNHIASEWSFVPLNKDPEVFPSEGYLIKTRGDASIDTETPEAYLYAKFAITSSNDEMTLNTRTFGENYTFFKVTAIKEDGTVSYLSPKSNTAQDASAAENGCWKFKHGDGGSGDPDAYASFVYDLSQFNGNNVVIAVSVHKGESNSDENKMAFYSINLN